MHDEIHPGDGPPHHIEVLDTPLDQITGLHPCQILSPAGREIIENPHLVASPQDLLAHVAPNKTTTASHKKIRHQLLPTLRPLRGETHLPGSILLARSQPQNTIRLHGA